EYQVGDDVRKIDWELSARENKVFVKEFLEEKDTSHYILLDNSASMKNKFFFAKILASSLLLSSNKSRDNFSIAFFNEKEIKIFPLSKNRNQVMRYIYEISRSKAEKSGNLKEIILKLLNLIHKKSLISIISDEMELDTETKSLLFALKHKHKLNYFHLFSSKEKNLDLGLNSFEDIETGISQIYDLDENDLKEYREEFEKQIKDLESDLLKIDIKSFIIDTDLDLNIQVRKKMEMI
ncbi:DUF58 domain-containing protein, partial [bacterium]|nr:DUF58 domain-containing protein [bacterium]